jgi:hypothetical protein
MDILSLAAIQLQCFECGGSYLVPLRDILLSHKVLHDGCPVEAETECPPVFQSRLASYGAINALDEAWRPKRNTLAASFKSAGIAMVPAMTLKSTYHCVPSSRRTTEPTPARLQLG